MKIYWISLKSKASTEAIEDSDKSLSGNTKVSAITKKFFGEPVEASRVNYAKDSINDDPRDKIDKIKSCINRSHFAFRIDINRSEICHKRQGLEKGRLVKVNRDKIFCIKFPISEANRKDFQYQW